MSSSNAGFSYRGSELCCGNIPLARLAKEFGTPLYVYSWAEIENRFRQMQLAFAAVPHTICYSVKANSNLAILRRLAKLGAGFDIVSGGELERVRRASQRALRKTVFSGVGKTETEMAAALRAGILMFNVESEAELELLASTAARLRKRAAVAFRVNPDVRAETHPHITTGREEHKFGVPIEDAPQLYRNAGRSPWLEARGISVHIGSQITSLQPFAVMMKRVTGLLEQLLADGHKITYLDAGGGLGIPYSSPREKFAGTAQAYARTIITPLHGRPVHLLLEPGRSIVGPAGLLLARVLYVKRHGSKNFAVLDAGMNDLMRPALYQAKHEIVAVEVREDARKATYEVVGPVCETGDTFATGVELPELRAHDLVAILDAGAYGMSLASNYNSRALPAEVLVDKASIRLIRRRQTAADLLRGEQAR